MKTLAVVVAAVAVCAGGAMADEVAPVPSIAEQKPNTWVKRSPLPGGPPSPRLGYESSWAYDPEAKRMIRWGAHDPGGGGPQLTETWVLDPETCVWEYRRTNNNPPGNCCCRENVFNPLDGVFTRFSYPAFGHGWYWDRSRYLREDSVWTYNLKTNTWTNMRPGKEPALNVGKPAVFDPNHQMIWVYDTKLRAYDPYTNTWHSVNQSEQIGKVSYGGMALDPEHNKLVLFGNQGRTDGKTWVYDIATDTWTGKQPKPTPPSGYSSPTLVYDSRNRKIIAIVLGVPWNAKDKTNAALETWTYDVGANTWAKMDPPVEPDYTGSRNRLMRYLPDKNIVILENRTRNEQQIWTYRLAGRALDAKMGTDPDEKTLRGQSPFSLPTPRGLRVLTGLNDSASLVWDRVKGAAGYHLYRGTGDAPWRVKYQRLTDEPQTGVTYSDLRLKHGTVYYYYVTAVSEGGQESVPSLKVRTQPRVIVNGRVDVHAKDHVVYSWAPSEEKDVVGYVVERAVLRPISAAQKVSSVKQYRGKVGLDAMVEKAALSHFQRLTPKPIQATTFRDTVDLSVHRKIDEIYWQPYFGRGGLEAARGYDMTRPGCPYQTYAYRVRAVNALGVSSGPSPYQMTVPNEVENLYSKEDGNTCHLRWTASPHEAIRGYLVFRLNGRGWRWDKDSHLVLLTPKPIRATTFTDPDVGGKTRRYYVVVVDALGQDGLPSHGAWAYRRWHKHYAPWLPKDGWHQ